MSKQKKSQKRKKNHNKRNLENPKTNEDETPKQNLEYIININPKGLTNFDEEIKEQKNGFFHLLLKQIYNICFKFFIKRIYQKFFLLFLILKYIEIKITQKKNDKILSILISITNYYLYPYRIKITNKNYDLGINREFNFSIIDKHKESFSIEETTDNSNGSIISNMSNSSKKENTQLKEAKNKPKFIELPDKPKGLNNFSLNCYMNSLLQCFYHIKGLRTSFIDPSKYSEETQKVCHSLSEVMKGLTYGKKNYYSPNNFKKTLGEKNKLFEGHKGADVSDLYRTVIDSIINEIPYEYPENDEDYENKKQNYEEAKKDVNPDNPINKELNFFYETIYRCPQGYNCYSVQNDSSIIFELLKISQYTKDKIDLYKCFDYHFRELQNNEFYCYKCKCKHKNTSRDKLLSLPKVLTIILNRGKGKQFVDKVEFDEIIDIKKYVDDTFIKEKKRKFKYKLIGVSTHIGSSSDYGHYIAYCYRENEKQYYCFNDTSTRKINFNELKEDEPYILFYEKIDDDINNI